MTDPGRTALTRRAALLAVTGVSAGLVGACDTAAPPPSTTPTGSPRASPAATATATPTTTGSPVPDPEPDREAVTALLGATELAHATVVEARRTFRRLRPRLATLLDVHEEHARVLRLLAPDASPLITAPGAPAADPDRALREVRRSENALRRDLGSAAAAVDSGDLARVLASMAGGVAAALAALDEPKVARA